MRNGDFGLWRYLCAASILGCAGGSDETLSLKQQPDADAALITIDSSVPPGTIFTVGGQRVETIGPVVNFTQESGPPSGTGCTDVTLAYSGAAFGNSAQFRAGAGIYRLSETTPTVLSYVAQPTLDTVADTAGFCASASGRYVVARPEACALAASANCRASRFANESWHECYADPPAIFEEQGTVVPWRSASELPATIHLAGSAHRDAVAWVLWGAPGEAAIACRYSTSSGSAELASERTCVPLRVRSETLCPFPSGPIEIWPSPYSLGILTYYVTTSSEIIEFSTRCLSNTPINLQGRAYLVLELIRGGETCGDYLLTASFTGATPTCATKGAQCGALSDSCGGVFDCGGCSAPMSCGGDGRANICGCANQACGIVTSMCGAHAVTHSVCEQIASCQAASGAFVLAKKADGSSCSDGQACNGFEMCKAGNCVPGVPPIIDDGNVCTRDECDDTAGVSHETIPGCTTCLPDTPVFLEPSALQTLNEQISNQARQEITVACPECGVIQ